ncbi:uncharacterized protein LOC119312315 [Triticum dicoccoides]|uniref:uncharacterized protein LOC119312315 n=1 Tax=Triticum dicoccoides TaxID=85692 RepID=UPI001890EF8D|nr:uncharacterized protein LOC119312315 [Triticum dicoccoides]
MWNGTSMRWGCLHLRPTLPCGSLSCQPTVMDAVARTTGSPLVRFDQRMDVFAETKLQRDGIELSTGFRVIKVSDDLIAVKYKSSGGESLVPYGMVVNISSNYRCSFVFGCMIGGRTCRTRSMCHWCTRRCRQEGGAGGVRGSQLQWRRTRSTRRAS